jgi:GMP synthase-like glutamine amidotransferase
VRVLAFRHVPFESGGRLETVLARRGVQLEYLDLYRGAETPLPAADALIFLGGPMSANDPLPFLHREMAIIREAAERAQPLLGICLGAQLIARAFGAEVRRNPQKEIGWYEVRLTDEGAADPIFAGVPRAATVFHWHSDTFDLPPAGVLLAASDRCARQAYRVGNAIYGLQFHLEATPQMIAGWCAEDENCADVRELEMPLDPWCNASVLDGLAEAVFGAWIEQVKCGGI